MKLKPETPEEIESVETVEGMWERILEYSGHDPFTSVVFLKAKFLKLSEEKTAKLLAYEALKTIEGMRADYLKQAMLKISPETIFIPNRRGRSEIL